MYKVKIDVLEGLKKELIKNNKLLTNIKTEANGLSAVTMGIDKQIKANEKQIKLLKNEYYID